MSFHCYNGAHLHCGENLDSSADCLHSPSEEAKHSMVLAVNHHLFSQLYVLLPGIGDRDLTALWELQIEQKQDQ